MQLHDNDIFLLIRQVDLFSTIIYYLKVGYYIWAKLEKNLHILLHT